MGGNVSLGGVGVLGVGVLDTAVLGAIGEEAVERAAGLVEDCGGLGHRGLVAGGADRLGRHRELTEGVPEFTAGAAAHGLARIGGRGLPRRRIVSVTGDGLAAGLGQLVGLAAVDLDRGDQALVLELREGGIDRARAGPPGAGGAGGEFLDELIAIARLLGDQQQRGETDIALGTASATTGATPAGPTPAGTPRSTPAARPARPAAALAVGALLLAVAAMVVAPAAVTALAALTLARSPVALTLVTTAPTRAAPIVLTLVRATEATLVRALPGPAGAALRRVLPDRPGDIDALGTEETALAERPTGAERAVGAEERLPGVLLGAEAAASAVPVVRSARAAAVRSVAELVVGIVNFVLVSFVAHGGNSFEWSEAAGERRAAVVRGGPPHGPGPVSPYQRHDKDMSLFPPCQHPVVTYGKVPSTTGGAMTDWVEHVLWWHVYPLGFVGSAHEPGGREPVEHRLPHLIAWLDHPISLGLNGILLGPVFASGSHGYDTIDYRRIDPRLGDDADFDALLAACRERGLRILLDGVFNHVGTDFPLFRQAVADGPGSEAAGAFRFHWDSTNDLGLPAYDCFEGHQALVELNHDAPQVEDLVVEVMCHWLGRGIDGWRLDAAYAVPEDFWARVLPRVRQRFPEAYVLGEVIHGDYAQFVARSGVDSVTQYELWKAIWSSLSSANFFELSHALARHDDFLRDFVPQTFVGNHDVTRIATQIADPRHLPHAYAVLLTVGGTPSIYYGDEMGYTGTKEERLGGDDQVRPSMPPTPDDLTLGFDTFETIRVLVGVRRRHPWLHRAQTRDLHLANASYAFELTGDGERIVLCLNLSDDSWWVDLDAVEELLAGAAEVAAGGISVPAHGWAVLRAGV